MQTLISNKRADARFYTCVVMGFIMCVISLFLPPIGVIPSSVCYVTGAFLITGGLALGLDIAGVIREIRLLKEFDLKNNDNNRNDNTQTEGK